MVVMAVGVNWDDWPNCSNSSDMEDYLDYLENENVTLASRLYQMVDEEAFGLSGHSSGGGLTLVNTALVERIAAAHTFAAAIGGSAVDSISQSDFWDTTPLFLQVGRDDDTYIEGSRRAFQKIGAINSLVEVIGSGHQGPYEHHLLISFYLYHLDGQTDYYPYIYGEETVLECMDSDYDLWFNFSDTHFFPPRVTGNSTPAEVYMDSDVSFSGDIEGYYLPDHPQSRFGWDFDNNGVDDFTDPTERNTSHAFTSPGTTEVNFRYRLGRVKAELVTPLELDVINVDPVAVASSDVTAEEDEAVHVDASGSHDTASDNGSLEFKWDFGDGTVVDFSKVAIADHAYASEGVYQVDLTVMDAHGAMAVDDLTVTVTNVAPTADAGFDVISQEDEEVSFYGAGNDTLSDIAGLEFKWDFGDGNVTDWSDDAEAVHTYVQEDVYEAVLSVRDDDDIIGTDSIEVSVFNVPPVGGITVPAEGDVFEEDANVDLFGWGDDTASDEGSIEYRWDMGDGTIVDWGQEDTTSHVYIASGNYTVTFSIRDDDGAVVNHSVTIIIENLDPTAEVLEPVSGLTVDEDQVVTFKGSGSDTPTDALALTFEWEIDGQTLTGETVEHTFTKSGIYDVWFTVTDPDGETASVSVEVKVRNVVPKVDADVEPLNIEEGGSINYTAVPRDTESDTDSLSVLWEFKDSTTSTNASGSHVFDTAGTYKVTVTVTDDDGAIVTKEFIVTVKGPPIVPPPPPPDDDDGKINMMMVYGGIAGLVVAIVVIVLILMMMGRRREKEAFFEPGGHPESGQDPPPAPAEGGPEASTDAPPEELDTAPEEPAPPADIESEEVTPPEEPPEEGVKNEET
jgi:PKD repeat protein